MAEWYYNIYPTLLIIVFFSVIIYAVVSGIRGAKEYEKQLSAPLYIQDVDKVPLEDGQLINVDGSPKI